MGELSGQSSFRSNGCTIGGLAWAAWAVPGHGGHRSSSNCAEGKMVLPVPNVPSQSPAEKVSSIASTLERMHYMGASSRAFASLIASHCSQGGREARRVSLAWWQSLTSEKDRPCFSSPSLCLVPQATWCQIGRGRGISTVSG